MPEPQEPAGIRRGSEALARPLAEFRAYHFSVECPPGSCPFRRVPVAPILDARPDLTVGAVLDRLRCQACGCEPEIVGLSGEGDWLPLRCAVQVRPKRVEPPRRPLLREVRGAAVS
ncbi:hypothetical protein [Roseomonas sp. BN140053]|uniref:hypothetical protein n=1 Tax=Roseomonas sp. BN140053 TaxID=3391898 RepID=UPI0039EA7B4E